jgi:hypothetical protein
LLPRARGDLIARPSIVYPIVYRYYKIPAQCDGSVSYAKRETTPKVRLEPKKLKRHRGA